MDNIDNLLKDIKNKFWRDRIKKSIDTILSMYNLSLSEISISREKVNPDELFIAAVEECNLERAREYLKENPEIPPPITVIQWRWKKVLFMGSDRAVKFVLQKRFPDCIVVKFPNYVKPRTISEARLTLKEVIDRQK